MLAVHSLKKETLNAYLGSIIALGSWAMLFITFLASYGVLRVQAETWISFRSWPALFWLASGNTLVILLSSWTYAAGSRAIRLDRVAQAQKKISIAIFFGGIFLILQLFVWKLLTTQGLSVKSDIASSMLYVLSGMHGIHVLAGLTALIFVLRQINRKKVSAQNPHLIILVGFFWHFLTVVWCLFFAIIFVIN
ncbi:hypothetical protein MNBD_UNCLBAC01-1782 [hydrothermal vent metagenome]|uniref:Heme-copper oxidase subunit III family profile domain-containing protein n=1 Tax=hydrothermal vent metagenome TaxID=652676 RepID=A0A3B1DGA5_9ZZZZ